MVIGTSLTFYRGYEAHQELLEQLRKETGLPVTTMTEAVVDGLKSVGAKRIAVATAYADEVNNRLADFLRKAGFEVLALEGFGLFGFGEPGKKSEQDIIELERQGDHRGQGGADAVLISCGGLLTLGLRRADRAAPRHSGGHQHAVGVLEGAAACRRQRPVSGPRPDAGAIAGRAAPDEICGSCCVRRRLRGRGILVISAMK